MKIKTSELTDAALDWAVAKCEGRTLRRNPIGKQTNHGWWVWEETPSGKGGILIHLSIYMEVGPRMHPKTRNSSEKYSPSTDWAQGGPITELEGITTAAPLQPGDLWGAWKWIESRDSYKQYGPTPLIAAMRCYVASRLGDEVNVPDELC